jgi:hypothetical protein
VADAGEGPFGAGREGDIGWDQVGAGAATRGSAGLPAPGHARCRQTQWQATDFEQLEPERLDLREHSVERGLVAERSR